MNMKKMKVKVNKEDTFITDFAQHN